MSNTTKQWLGLVAICLALLGAVTIINDLTTQDPLSCSLIRTFRHMC